MLIIIIDPTNKLYFINGFHTLAEQRRASNHFIAYTYGCALHMRQRWNSYIIMKLLVQHTGHKASEPKQPYQSNILFYLSREQNGLIEYHHIRIRLRIPLQTSTLFRQEHTALGVPHTLTDHHGPYDLEWPKTYKIILNVCGRDFF